MVQGRLGFICGALLTIVIAPGCDSPVAVAKAADRREQSIHVEAKPAVERTVPRHLRLTGTLEANRDSDVAADAAGRVAATFVERGSYVKKGTVLARLDARSFAIAAAQAKADAAAAKADAELRASELARTDKLVAQKALAQAELDRAKAAQESADHRAAAADARVASQEKSIGDAFIRAPFDGLVVERWVDEGEYVRADSRIITLVDVQTLRLKLTVPESSAGTIAADQRVSFEVGAIEPKIERSALVKFVGPALRQSSRDLIIEAFVDNADRVLKPGMFATAKIEAGEQNVSLVPATAVKTEGGTKRLFVVGTGGKLEERIVQLGERLGDEIIVVDGIRKQEKVVSVMTGELRDGLKAE